MRDQHVDRDAVGVQPALSSLVPLSTPQVRVPVEEVLDGEVDAGAEVPELHDGPGHEGHGVQVPPADDVQSLVEVLETPRPALGLELQHLPDNG